YGRGSGIAVVSARTRRKARRRRRPHERPAASRLTRGAAPLNMPRTMIPRTMTAVEIREPGAPQVLRAVERPVPQPLAGEVLIRDVAAGVNRPDVLLRDRKSTRLNS